MKFLQGYRILSSIPDLMGKQFYKFGFIIASHPWKTIILSLVTVIVLGCGNLKFYFEKQPMNLWVPTNDRFRSDTKYLFDHFQDGYRQETILFTARNIFDPKVLKKAAIIDRAIKNFSVEIGGGKMASWEDLCFKIPLIIDVVHFLTPKTHEYKTIDVANAEEDDDDDELSFKDDVFFQDENTSAEHHNHPRPYNPAIDLAPELFCKIANNLPTGCRVVSVLELWKYDPETFDNLTTRDVLEMVNTAKTSPVTGYPLNFLPLLSGVRQNTANEIISAGSMLSHYFLYLNLTNINYQEVGNAAGTEEWASADTLAWEGEFIKLLKRLKDELEDDDFKFYFISERSIGDSTAEDFEKIILHLAISVVIMFVYMQLVLSKYSWTELRFILGTVGLACVGLAVIVTCGLCSAFGIPYTPIHTSFPLLLMGLGVDDIFVMMANWKQIQETKSDLPIPEKIALMVQQAGISITVTSITDFAAFLVGIFTIVPILKSYCIYSAVGVLVIYILVVTLFVAVFTLDEYRIAAQRHSIFPCIVRKGKSTTPCCELNLMHRFLKFVYSKIILTGPGKIFVIVISIAFVVIGFLNMIELDRHADGKWLYAKSSYQYQYETKRSELYPRDGYEAEVLIGDINFFESFGLLRNMSQILSNRTEYITSFDSWVEPFAEFVSVYYEKEVFSSKFTDSEFREYFSKFLFSPEGGRYQQNFRFERLLECGQPIPPIEAAIMQFQYLPRNATETYRGKHTIQEIVEESIIRNSTNMATTWSKVYGIWSSTERLNGENSRNILYGLICVLICTAILIVNVQMCVWIFVCVVATLLSVAGGMQLLGMKIDVVVNLSFLLAVGLCVDYAAHIGHTFLTMSKGNRNDRALDTILHIAAAIIYGAGSTLLAMCMLSVSDVNLSVLFFQQVTLVVGFGVFYGIVLLPVILSLVGPAPYKPLGENSSTDTKL